jgi:hypothetical protein
MNADDTDFFVFGNTSEKSLIFCQSVKISVDPCPMPFTPPHFFINLKKYKKTVTFFLPWRLISKTF